MEGSWTSDSASPEYRPVSVWAIAGLLSGLAGAVVLIDSMLWPIPVAGLGLSATALVQLARRPYYAGRWLARVGLFLALVFAVAAPVESLYYRWRVQREAVAFSRLWFEFLAKRQPQMAFQLTREARTRPPLDSALWDFYRRDTNAYEELQHYITRPLIRTLLNLGEKAEVRYMQTEMQYREADRDNLDLVYAVTYEAPERQSFFVRLRLERSVLWAKSGSDLWAKGGWQLQNAVGGVRPAGWRP